ncbi:MAG: hypothetical protein EBS48_05130 [Actinobacteria bacterium]|nr:hypothetical protein [Actinomycetota bacterium]
MATCLDLCARAYAQYNGDPKDPRSASRVVVDVVGDTTYVAFAGTETKDDVKVDASVGDVQVPWTPAKARAHAGFSKAYQGLRDSVRDAVRDAVAGGGAKVVFTGHSLGGALATLAALDAALNDPSAPEVQVYTFGAPHVGDGNFVELFDRRVPTCVRVVNPFDPVPKLLASQFVHTKGYYATASLTRDAPITAHFVSTYRLALSRPRWVQIAGSFAPVSYVAAAAAVVVAYHLARRRGWL